MINILFFTGFVVDSPDINILRNHSLEEFFKQDGPLINGQPWKSTYTTADRSDVELEDQVWLGIGKTGLGPMFDKIPVTKSKWRFYSDLLSIYRLSFRNNSEYHIAIVGQIIHAYFKDTDGMIWKQPEIALNFKASPLIYARIDLLPEVCKWKLGAQRPDLVSILRCVHNNLDQPAVDLPPGAHLLGKDRILGKLDMELTDLVQLFDENLYKGRCLMVKNSNVVVTIADPNDPSVKFVMDMLFSMGETASLNDKHDDPCGALYRCLPKQRLLKLKSKKIWSRAASKIQHRLFDLNVLRYGSEQTVDFVFNTDSFLMTLWEDLGSNLIIKLSVFFHENEFHCEIEVPGSQPIKQKLPTNLFSMRRFILRSDIFAKTLEVCNVERTICERFELNSKNIRTDIWEAKFLFYNFLENYQESQCNDIYKCTPFNDGNCHILNY